VLGICVVYLVPSADAELLLQIGLRQLNAMTDGPYRIYGVALRLSDELTHKLRGADVVLPEIPPYKPDEYAGNRKAAGEHSHYLDQLVDFAFKDGCSRVATFDMDSWPLAQGWNSHYARFLTPDIPVVAMRRAETGDEFPNPAFTMIHDSFWRPGQTSFAFFNPRSRCQGKGVIARAHSGAGLLAELADSGKTFLPLIRTNQWNPHPIMCGIYDHRIFHFGAGSRRPAFAADKQDYNIINTELSVAYAKTINEAKRAFFLECLKRVDSEFMRQLAFGGPANQAP
jgi:hypothetical protein